MIVPYLVVWFKIHSFAIMLNLIDAKLFKGGD